MSYIKALAEVPWECHHLTLGPNSPGSKGCWSRASATSIADFQAIDTSFLGAYGTPRSLWRLTQEAEARLMFGMTSVRNDKCSEWHVFGMTSVRNDKCSDGHLFGMTMILLYKYFMTKIFFAPINFQVFLKHLPGHKESIGILGKQIGQWEGSENDL